MEQHSKNKFTKTVAHESYWSSILTQASLPDFRMKCESCQTQ